MNKYLFIGALLASSGLIAQVDLINKVSGNGSRDGKSFEFTTIYDLEATPVKDQGRSGTCWSY